MGGIEWSWHGITIENHVEAQTGYVDKSNYGGAGDATPISSKIVPRGATLQLQFPFDQGFRCLPPAMF